MKALYPTLTCAALLLGYSALPSAETQAVAKSRVTAQTETQSTAERYLCDERAAVVGELSGQFKERPVAHGLQGNGTLLEVFASRETGSWTVLITLPTGVTCLTLVGDSFEMLPDPVEGPRV